MAALALFPPALAGEENGGAAPPAGGEKGRIAQIHVVPEDVFAIDKKDPFHHLYRLGNWIHIETRPYVVRRLLLFDEGDRLDPLLLAESERLLRAQDQFQAATVTATARPDGDYDVLVTTRDKWSLSVGVGVGLAGGVAKGSANVSDSNFLGLAKEVALSAQVRSDRRIARGTYFDPNLFGTRVQLFAEAAVSDLGTLFTGSIGQPFYARETAWAWDIEGEKQRSDFEYFRRGKVFAEIRRDFLRLAGSGGLGFGPTESVKRLRLGVAFERALFDAPRGDDPLAVHWPRNRDTFDVTLTGSLDRFSAYRKLERIDADRIVEDVAIGWSVEGAAGPEVRLDSRGTSVEALLAASALFAIEPARGQVLAAGADWTMRRAAGRTEARSATWFVRHYIRLFDAQTIAWNLDFTLEDEREDLEAQLTLGEDNGLRGYRARLFDGTRRLRLNVEDRIFSDLHLFTFYLGFVVFADAGMIWRSGDRLSASDVHPSVGFGFRVFSAELLKTQVGRLDIAFPLDPDEGFGVSVSVSSGQVFTLFERREDLAARF
jgi:hypothetical protein